MLNTQPTSLLLTSKSTQLLLLVLAITSLGCRATTDNQIDLLERELRVQEDYIYELEDYVVEYSEKLRDMRAYPQQTAGYAEEIVLEELNPPEFQPQKSQSQKSKPRSSSNKRKPKPKTDEDVLPTPPEPQSSPKKSPTEISPEEMEIPDELDLQFENSTSKRQKTQRLQQAVAVKLERQSSIKQANRQVLSIPDPTDFVESMPNSEPAVHFTDEAEVDDSDEQFVEALFADEHSADNETTQVDRVVDHLKVVQLFQSEGDKLSPQNLLTVVEALDAKGEPVDLDGEVSLMVMTTDEATPQRLKRWNFTAAETIAAWQSSDLGDGLHLELPLEKMELPGEPLEIWVRLVTADGRKFLTQLPFQPDQLTDIVDASPQPQPRTGLAQIESETTHAPTQLSVLNVETDSDQSTTLKNQKTDVFHQGQQLVDLATTSQPRWRSSMQRTDRPVKGFATSNKTQSWKTQSLTHSQHAPVRVASRTTPAQPRHTLQPRPTWTSGRSVFPDSSTTTQNSSASKPASWSTSR